MRTVNAVPDPRVREFLTPARVVWRSDAGALDADALLMPDDSVCRMRREHGADPPGVLLDYGRELHGGVRIDCPTNSTGRPVRMRVRFGESASEAMGTPNNDHTIHDFEMLVPWMGHQEVGNTGFRFVRLDLLEEGAELQLRRADAVSVYRPEIRQGSFECSDERLNLIWETGAHTVHLCMQDRLWDGVKRDRLVWLGDMHPETMVVSTVYGESPVVPESLDYVRDRTPVDQWMNGISSYSLWWVLCQSDWYRYHGNDRYLAEQRDYLVALLQRLAGCIGSDGRETLDGMRFLEWPTARDATAIDAGLQALMTMALRAGAELCRTLGETAMAAVAWDASKRAAACRRAPTPSKQANALTVLAGQADASETNASILALDPFRGLSTFYGYYVLQARALAGDIQGCLDLIRAYWGGMLDAGATTFWEHFDLDWLEGAGRIDELTPEGLKDLHADFGDHCFVGLRHSLCHGWAAGPTAWLTEHILGLSPAEPGFSRVRVAPALGDLSWARGTIPTPHGPVTVENRIGADGGVETTVDLPEEIDVVG